MPALRPAEYVSTLLEILVIMKRISTGVEALDVSTLLEILES